MTVSTNPTSPLISVIIPVYNGERFLESAMQNVLDQDYTPLELIVVDDGSTDATAQIAARWGDNIHYVFQPRRGPSAARNRGIRMAQGDIIAFLDVDDLWPRCTLQWQVAHLAAHQEIDIVQGLIVNMQLDVAAPGPEWVFVECSDPYQFINLGSAVYRTKVFDTVGLFDENLRENADFDWFLRAWENNVVKVVHDRVVLYYRLHTQNVTHEQRPPQLRIIAMFKRHLDRYRQQGRTLGDASPHAANIATYIGTPPLRNKST